LFYSDPYGLFDVSDPATWPMFPQSVENAAAGAGDTVSWGATDFIREQMGWNSGIDKCSFAYGVGEAGGLLASVAFGGGTIGRHAVANGAKSIFAESRMFKTISRRWHNIWGGGAEQLDHMFFPQKGRYGNWVNSGFNLVPLSPWVNGHLLNPDSLLWTKRHRLLGKFVPQALRGLARVGVVALWGAIPMEYVRPIDGDRCGC